MAKTSASASPPTQDVPLKTSSRASSSGPGRVGELGRAEDRLRLARQRRHVDLERSLEQARVGRDPVPLREEQHVAGNELARVDHLALCRHGGQRPAAAGSGVSASTARSACRSCANAKTALRTMTATIARAEHRDPGDEGERGGEPEEERERVDELLWRAGAASVSRPGAQLVRPVRDEPPLGLPAREPFGPSAEVAEQPVDRLPGVSLHVDRDGLLERSHPVNLGATACLSIGARSERGCGKPRTPLANAA